jgi:hypothetical protein
MFSKKEKKSRNPFEAFQKEQAPPLSNTEFERPLRDLFVHVQAILGAL